MARQPALPPAPPPREDYFGFRGGLDVVTPPMELKPGFLIECLNFDIPATGGYRRIPGYERFDGRTRPSDAQASLLAVTAPPLGVSVVLGATVNGQTSGATGKVVYIAADRSYCAVTRQTGVFQLAENLRVGVTVVGVIGPLTGSISGDIANQIAAAAADEYRLDITAVPGSGPIRGVCELNGTVYAFRDNAGGTACAMYRSSVSGWQLVAFGEEIEFTLGKTGLVEGGTLTQGGVSATIARLIITSGTLAGSNAAGRMILTGRAGGNFAAGATTGAGTPNLSGAQTAVTLPPGGKYRSYTHNFFGNAGAKRLYLANGVSRGMEFDGTNLVPLTTGMSPDAPQRVWVHRNYLVFAFNASVQFSGPGNPYQWSVVLGANEIGVGDTVTDFATGPGQQGTGALIIHTQEKTFALYGNSPSDWNLQTANDKVGCRSHTSQTITQPLFLDKLGVTSLSASQNFGNFADAQLTDNIRTYLTERLDLALTSCVVRKENQYKLFFSDNTGLTMTFQKGKLAGCMPFLLSHTINVACDSDTNGGTVFLGATNGFVYELNRGRGFDGAAIPFSMRLAYNFNGSPKLRKRYRRATFDLAAPSYGSFTLSYQASRGDPDIDVGTAQQVITFNGGGSALDDTGFGLDLNFELDGSQFTRAGGNLDLTATDISIALSGSSANQFPWAATGMVLTWEPRRSQRQG